MPTALRPSPILAALTILVLLAGPAGAACDPGAFRILVDTGHTPGAPGAISARGQTEYSFNYHLAAAIERELKARGYRLTARFDGADEGRAVRLAAIRAAAPDLLISVHHDSVQRRYLEAWEVDGRPQAYSDRFSGWSLFVSGRNPRYAESLRAAELIGAELLRRGWAFSRHHAERIPGEGRPWANPARGIYRYDGLAVLQASPGPAVLLEAGVIVNRRDEEVLADPDRRAGTAAAVGEAVDRFCASR